MEPKNRRLPSPALVTAITALIVAMSGIAWAQSKIGTSDIARHAVEAPKIDHHAVKGGKIRSQAVKGGKIRPGAVKTGKIQNGAVDNAKIANGAVNTEKIANDTVTGQKVNESTLGAVPSVQGLDRGDVVTAMQGQVKPLAEKHGFRWELSCTATTTDIQIVNVNGGDDSAFDDNVGGPDVNDFDVGETELDQSEGTANEAENGGTVLYGSNGTVQYALFGMFNRPATGFGGADCVASLNLLVG